MIPGFVLDCSVAVSWYLSDENSPYSDWVLRSLESTGALVPRLWHLEIANVLLNAEKKGCIKEASTSHFIHLLNELPLEVDDTDPSILDLVSIGRAHSLTSYDSCYLHLALTRGLPIATLDERLKQEAVKTGVNLYTE